MTKIFQAVRNLNKLPASPRASEQLMAWLEETPRTYGWGAILAYDRQKANKMLKQEYISRFNSESVMLPVDIDVPGGAERKQLYGYEFDAPLMSFENYSDSDIKNEPRCVIRMPIVAGSYKTVAAKGIVTSISVFDSLDGQVLSMIMNLETGTVNDKNQVMFNIAKGTEFSVDVNNNYLDQVEVGSAFKAYFESALPDDKKVWALSQIDTSKNQYLKPAIVKLSVRKRGEAAEIADGELIICVSMEGDVAGYSLPEDFKYLTELNSAVIILGQKTLLDKAVSHQILNYYPSADTRVVLDGNLYKLNVISGSRISQAKEYYYVEDGSTYPVKISSQEFFFGDPSDGNGLSVGVDNGVLRSRWIASNAAGVQAGFNNQWGARWHGLIKQSWLAFSEVEYIVKSDGSGVVASDVMSHVIEWGRGIECTNIPDATAHLRRAIEELCPQFRDEYLPELDNTIITPTVEVISDLPELNTFVLESILFKNEDTVLLSSCALPNDLVMFGEVGPSQAAYEITPMEAVMLNGETQQFAITPLGATGVTWSIESASGDPLFIGSIDATSGLYTAPDLGNYQGSQARVRVIATQGGYKTYALVSVLKKTITVNPLVTVKVIGEDPSDADKVTLTANTADGIPPKWSLKKTGTEGTLDLEEGFSNVYTPRPYDEVEDAYVVDEIILTDSNGLEQRAIIVVNHAVNINSAMTEGSATATTVQLQCKVGKDDVTPFTEFNVLLGGAGTISETGLYTQAAEVKEPFALVGCNTSYFGSSALSYILIPLPLSPYEGGE